MGDDGGQHVHAGPADVPAVPVIPRGELGSRHTAPRIIAPTRGKHFIGWQPRRDRKDDADFVVIFCTVFDSLKVIERFPLTDDGWRQAWLALVRIDTAAAELAQAMFAEQASQARASAHLAELEAATIGYLPEIVFLGGYAPEAELTVRGSYDLRFLTDRLGVFPCQHTDALVQVPYRDVEGVDIGGPGLVKSGGGFVGGGFGVAGAVEGMAIAAVLNALTKQAKINTVIRVQARECELFLLCTYADREALRIELSRALGAIRQGRVGIASRTDDRPAASLADQLGKLAAMLESELLTREEFDRMKAALIAQA
jgi:hypothetical protein